MRSIQAGGGGAGRRKAARSGALVGALLLGACGGGGEADAHAGVRAVATTSMIAWAVEQVGGARVEVEGADGSGRRSASLQGDGERRTAALGRGRDLLQRAASRGAMGELLEQMAARARTVAVTEGVSRDCCWRRRSSRATTTRTSGSTWRCGSWRSEAVARGAGGAGPGARGGVPTRTRRGLTAELRELDAWVHARVAELAPEIARAGHRARRLQLLRPGVRLRGARAAGDQHGVARRARRTCSSSRSSSRSGGSRRSSWRRRSRGARSRRCRRRCARAASRWRSAAALFSDALGDPGTARGPTREWSVHNVDTIVTALSRGGGVAGAAT